MEDDLTEPNIQSCVTLSFIDLYTFFFFQMASASDTKWQKDAADQNFDYMFKLLIIGNSSVGKTSFLFRYADDSFTSAFVSTVGIDFKVKTVFRQDKRVKLQIWVSLSRSLRGGVHFFAARAERLCSVLVCVFVTVADPIPKPLPR